MFGRYPIQISAGSSPIQKEVLRGFCQSINANAVVGPQIEPPLFVSNLLFKVKDKGQPVNCHSRHRGQSRCNCTLSLTSALDRVGGQRHRLFYPRGKRPGEWAGLGAGLDRKISSPTRVRSLDRPVRSGSIYRLSYRGRRPLFTAL